MFKTDLKEPYSLRTSPKSRELSLSAKTASLDMTLAIFVRFAERIVSKAFASLIFPSELPISDIVLRAILACSKRVSLYVALSLYVPFVSASSNACIFSKSSDTISPSANSEAAITREPFISSILSNFLIFSCARIPVFSCVRFSNAPTIMSIARRANSEPALTNSSKLLIKAHAILLRELMAAVTTSTPPGFAKRLNILFSAFGSVLKSFCIAPNAPSISAMALSANSPVNLPKFSIKAMVISVSLFMAFTAKSTQPASRKAAILSDATRSIIVLKEASICAIILPASSLFASKFWINAIACLTRLLTAEIKSC